MNIMKKKADELLRLARNALEKAGANPVMAAAAAKHLVRAEGIEVADDLLAKIEKLAVA